MPRKFISKGVLTTDRTALEQAFKYRVDTGCTVRAACKKFGVRPTTLQDAFKRSKKDSDGKTIVPIQTNINRVFSNEQERHLEEYAIKIAQMFYGLPVREFRKLALSYAEACGSKTIPDAWLTQGMATRDWYYAYMSRQPNLSLKAPEGMSIARAMAFKRTNVDVFFKAYTEAIARYEFTPDRIYNMDESGLSTMMKPVKVVCQRGFPVASQVSQERGAHMTFVGFINAAGHYIPPVFIVARKRMNPDFLRGTIDGTSVLLHHNGWMTHEGFLDTLKHLHAKTCCSVDKKVLLIMDNAECHMSIHAVEYAIQYGIVIVTLPPHTTAKLQPLDVSIFGPFKSFLRVLQNDFKLTHPNVAITEHMLPEMACKAWIKACTPSNVLSGFQATGIWPINRNIFSDEAFAGAKVSEQESAQSTVRDVSLSDSEELQTLDQASPTPSSSGLMNPDYPVAGPSGMANPPPAPLPRPELAPDPASWPSQPGSVRGSSSSPGAAITPEDIRPFPRGPARTASRSRKKIKACILTEDPQALDQLRSKEGKKLEKQRKQLEKKKEKQGKKDSKKRKNPCPSDDSSEEEVMDSPRMSLDDSSDFSEDLTGELEESFYPFVEKEPEDKLMECKMEPYILEVFLPEMKKEDIEDALSPTMFPDCTLGSQNEKDDDLILDDMKEEYDIKIEEYDIKIEEYDIKIEEEDVPPVDPLMILSHQGPSLEDSTRIKGENNTWKFHVSTRKEPQDVNLAREMTSNSGDMTYGSDNVEDDAVKEKEEKFQIEEVWILPTR